MGRAGLSEKQTTKMETQVRLVVMRIDEVSRIILVYLRKERGSYRKLGSLCWNITGKKVSAIIFFHRIAGLAHPCQHHLVKLTVWWLKNRLGSQILPSQQISLSSTVAARTKAAANSNTGLLNTADICTVMHEAQLWWDDIANIRLGDIIWSDSAVRLLIVHSKNDKWK